MKTYRLQSAFLVVLLLAASFLVINGCESDSTAPNDELPTLTEEDTAIAAGYLASYAHQAYSIYSNAIDKGAKGIETFSSGGVAGSYTLTFRTGGATGAETVESSSDYVRGYTDTGQSVTVSSADGKLLIATCTFDVHADPYNNLSETGNVSGTGRIVAGEYVSTFTITDVELGTSTYPPSGTMAYDNGDAEATVTFNGTRNASLTVGSSIYNVDLDTGEVTTVVDG